MNEDINHPLDGRDNKRHEIMLLYYPPHELHPKEKFEWKEGIPDQKGTYFVKNQNGDIKKAFFYPDQMAWAAQYYKTSYWYQATKPHIPLFDIIEWGEGIKET